MNVTIHLLNHYNHAQSAHTHFIHFDGSVTSWLTSFLYLHSLYVIYWRVDALFDFFIIYLAVDEERTIRWTPKRSLGARFASCHSRTHTRAPRRLNGSRRGSDA